MLPLNHCFNSILVSRGPGITQSDLLVINKTDLADAVGADLKVMERDAALMRSHMGPTVFAQIKSGKTGLDEIIEFIIAAWKQSASSSK